MFLGNCFYQCRSWCCGKAGRVLNPELLDEDYRRANNRIREVVATEQDTKPPVTTAAAYPAPNSNGWNNTNVTVSFAWVVASVT